MDLLTSAMASGGSGGAYGSQSYTYDSNTGNLNTKAGISYTYDTIHEHAVASTGSDTFGYDANGNQTSRTVSGSSYTLSYDAENRLVNVSGTATATFVYDGDGNRVKGTIGGVTTTYIGNYFEWTGSTTTMKKYYYAGTTRVVMRTGTSTLNYLLGDHLGSQAITANSSGVKSAEVRYYPWGTERWSSGILFTSFRFTGQRLEDYIKLYWYGSRWFDPALGRFISPDPIIPEPYNPLAYDRYQYAYSNPVRYTDSSGHCIDGVSTWICIAILLKIIDYGWTAYDAYQSSRVLANPNASREDKLLAGLNIGLAALFEAAEPDDLLPTGLPLDDAARKAVMKGAKEAFEEGGEEALEKFLRDNLGDYADDVIEKIGVGQAVDVNKLNHIFNNPNHHLDNLLNAFGGNEKSTYNAVWREFSNVAGNYSAKELREGIQITINGITLTVRGSVVDGVARIGTFFVP